ncbi:MAG: LacI family DNA-binding transcriptional regulator [Verrucomicrobiota bacterium]
MCANDRTAGDLMRGLLALGVRIPDQVRLVGIDDLPFAGLLPVPLTTVHQPSREIGRVAMAVMLDRLAQPTLPARDVLLDSRLVIRESCGAQRG